MAGRRRPGRWHRVTDPDPARPRRYDDLADRIQEALGQRVLQLEQVGSTSVPGLAAKPGLNRLRRNERLRPFPLGCHALELATRDAMSYRLYRA